jgi:hypothetical protein
MSRAVALALIVISLPLAVFLGGGVLMLKVSGRGLDGPEPPMRKLRYTSADVQKYWEALGERVPAEMRLLEIDLVFPLLVGAALLTSLLMVSAELGSPIPRWAFVGLAGVLVLADWSENLVLIRELAGFSAHGKMPDATWIAIASAATTVKVCAGLASAAAILVMIGFAVGGAIRAAQ